MTMNRIDTGASPAPPQRPRRCQRVSVEAEVIFRRPGQNSYRVRLFDASPHGCKVEFVERPRLDEHAWVKFDGMEALEASVCWIDGHVAGVEFESPIHPAVFDALIKRLK